LGAWREEFVMARVNRYPEEFRVEAVRLALGAKAEGRPLAHVAKDLSVNPQTLANWVAAEQVESGDRPGLTRAERAELVELRRRVKRLEMEREIMGKAAAFFASEGRYGR
jgi:transposase